jgi:hypothetical protein
LSFVRLKTTAGNSFLCGADFSRLPGLWALFFAPAILRFRAVLAQAI